MARILFLAPPVGKINGGVKYLFRMAEGLIAAGHDAAVFERGGARPSWFASTAPVVGPAALRPDPDQVIVVPEDQHEALVQLRAWPQRKIIYCQNQFYAALGIGGAAGFSALGVSGIICSSETILADSRQRHADLPAWLVPCGVDPVLFAPATKTPLIAYVPRKRPVEAMYLRDRFPVLYPRWASVRWEALDNLDEAALAARLGTAAVFLALSRLDGFGLTPIEAMAAGCVVAGFTGLGGREYATDANGFWADEDDFPACLAGLDRALNLALGDDDAAKAAYAAAAARTAGRYTPAVFAAATKAAWAEILR